MFDIITSYKHCRDRINTIITLKKTRGPHEIGDKRADREAIIDKQF